jgi:serine/threonine-protein kinase
LLVLGALAASWYFASREDTVEVKPVPTVVGAQRDEAEQELEERGFESEVKLVDSERPPGVVVAQRPDPGAEYGEGGIVVLTVARDPQRVEVPRVVGLRSRQAAARLRAAELRSRPQTIRSDRPEGQVIRQIPAAGEEVPKGSEVVLIVSSGRQQVEVPSLVGSTAEEATTTLTQAGFRTQVTRVASTKTAGTVVGQNPAAGTQAPRGSVVRINVARGQTQTATTVVTTTAATPEATVPDVVGQDEATAISTIEGAGFRTRVVERAVTDAAQDGIVIRQSPAGGSSGTRDSTVTITVGRLR